MRFAEASASAKIGERSGTHIVAYYCSDEHRLLKSAMFVCEGIRLGERCLYSLAQEDHQALEELLERRGVNLPRVKMSGQLRAVDFQRMYDLYRTEGAHRLAEELELVYRSGLRAGFSGVRTLVDTRKGIVRVDDEMYWHWEQELDQILMRIPMVTLCLYDIQDLLSKDQHISSKLIFRTMNCHRYFLNDNTFIRLDDFVKNRA